MKGKSKILLDRNCSICHQDFKTYWSKEKYCSGECKEYAVKLQQRAKYFRRKARQTDDPVQKQKYLKQAQMGTKAFCGYCSAVFETFGQNLQYCSDNCRKNQKKKAKLLSQGRSLTTVKKLLSECKNEEVKINPYFLSRGERSENTGVVNMTAGY
jgi:predicted nucleic acid-binding Zn ribbon protein